jgi:signal transduction histidine kinase
MEKFALPQIESKWPRLFAHAGIYLIIVFALSNLAGWQWDIGIFKSLPAGTAPMNPLTAIGLACSCVGTILLYKLKDKKRKTGLIKLLAVFVFSIGFLKISSEVLFPWLNFDKWLFYNKLLETELKNLPTSIAYSTAFNFILTGCSIFILSLKKESLQGCVRGGLLIIGLISLSTILGYIYGVDVLSSYLANSLMAFNTAVCFFLLSISMLLFNNKGFVHHITSRYKGGIMARYLLPVSIIFSILFGVLRLFGERSGWYSNSIGVALFTLFNIVILVVIILKSSIPLNWFAVQLEKEISQREKKEEELKELQLNLEDIITKRTNEAMQLRNELDRQEKYRQMDIMQATLNAEDKERTKIGEELHDNVNQLLASAKLYVEAALHDESDWKLYISRGKEIISTGIEEIRKLSKALVLPKFEQTSLIRSIEELASLIAETTKLHFQLDVSQLDERKLKPAHKLLLYRIIQEQLTNILKHAHASLVEIRLDQDSSTVRLTIIDNGKGFDTRAARKGIGISNMQNRVSYYNGRVAIFSEKNVGTTLNAAFDVNV